MSYRKVEQRIWNDAKFLQLTRLGKLQFLFALTHPNMTALGAMRATVPGLTEELGADPDEDSEAFGEAFREAFRDVCAKGLMEYDNSGRLLAIPNFLKYNRPESPNVVKAWAWAADQLPECEGKNRVLARARDFAEGLTQGFRGAFREAFDQASSNQEPEPEQGPFSKPNLPNLPNPPSDTATAERVGREGGRGRTDFSSSSRSELHVLFLEAGVTGSLADQAAHSACLTDEAVIEVSKGFSSLVSERRRQGAANPPAALAGRCIKGQISQDLIWLRKRRPARAESAASGVSIPTASAHFLGSTDERMETLSRAYLTASGFNAEPPWWSQVAIVENRVLCPVEAWVAEDLASAATTMGLSVEFPPAANNS